MPAQIKNPNDFDDTEIDFKQGQLYVPSEHSRVDHGERARLRYGKDDRIYVIEDGRELNGDWAYFVLLENLAKAKLPRIPYKDVLIGGFAYASRTITGGLRLERSHGSQKCVKGVSKFSRKEFCIIKQYMK